MPTPAAAPATAPRAARNPLAALRRGWQRWWLARLPRTDQLTLTQRNVYILPTGAGWMLGLTLLVLLLASINYQLNLGYLLTFLLAGSAVVGMHMAHGTLRGLTLVLKAPEPTFVGQSARLDVQLINPRRTPRYGIALSVQTAGPAAEWAWTDVPAQGQAPVPLAFRARQRGLQTLPLITAETRFPLGTFRVWAHWRPAAPWLAYPAPEQPAPPLPPGDPADGAHARTAPQGMGEWDGVRAYRRGDPPKSVVWKKAAQALATGSEALVSRDTPPAPRHALWLDLARTRPSG
ncbi:MAG: DUF58 domain-containing protein, partial [Burkholderiaceae bacterium]|nr:DUF58 domain-containing protein [Burkholderiaceae bacterium]